MWYACGSGLGRPLVATSCGVVDHLTSLFDIFNFHSGLRWDPFGSGLGRPLVTRSDLVSNLRSDLGLDLTYLCEMRVGRGLEGH